MLAVRINLGSLVMVQINSAFSAGNIEVIKSDGDSNVQLAIKADNQSEFKQWFFFKANNALGKTVNFEIKDADKTAYPDGWQDYNTCCSYDGVNWFRIPTQFENNTLSFTLSFEQSCAYFAYFAPYSYERHLQLVQQSELHPLCSHKVLGETLDGREMNLLTIGNPKAKKKVWMIARQHPGETMAEWFMEGVIARLLDETDGVAQQLLQHCCFYLVPNMNPDGTERGHLRTNAIGVNLNRQWDKMDHETCPEVCLVKEAMEETGLDLFIDVHGDEGLPYNFIAGCEGIPRFDADWAKQEQMFKDNYMAATPEFQDEFGYPKDEPGQADLSIASSWVGQEYGCLAMTLEMPFKDNANLPDEDFGWSPERSMMLGESILIPIYHHFKQ